MTPADAFLERKARELKHKLESLPSELKEWRAKAVVHGPLAKNHSQIERVTYRIEGYQKKIKEELDAAVQAGDLWTHAEKIETKALLAHMIWDFFRIRFSLRTISPFDRYLSLCDAFARACYEPAIRLLKQIPNGQLCPAPLVTFNNKISPWATPADPPAEDVGDTAPTFLQLQKAVETMPLVLLGVPWSYLTYLPHMALLAHEAGHAVERDGGLEQALPAAIAQVPLKVEDRRPAWEAWTREVFADVFACWMAGPAFVWSLADFLAAEEGSIARQTRPRVNGEWTVYPTATLRVRLCCQILEDRGFVAEAKSIRDAWTTAYPSYHLAEYEEDFRPVSSALAATARLGELQQGPFKPQDWQKSVTDVKLLAAGAGLGNDPQTPPVYVGAARVAVNEKKEPQVTEIWSKLVDHYVETRSPDLAGPETPAPSIDPEDEMKAGAALANLL